ncbi:MAG: tetratricopeptide repeat protein [Byssovorax sp.]
MSSARWALGAALALCFSVSATASADDVCISPQAVAALTACPGSPADRVEVSAHRGAKIAAPASPPGAARDPRKPPSPGEPASAPEIRRGTGQKVNQGPIAQGVVTIQQLESLLAATPADAPDRPKLLKRLGDEYVELESQAFRRKIESRVQASDIARKDDKGAKALLAEGDKAEKIESAARQAAIRHYGQLKSRYPNYCQFPNAADPAKSQGCGDEVLYDLAYEHEQDKKPDEARKAYLELIQRFPVSRYVPSAYLAFGELFFAEAQADPSRLPLAEQSYKEVIKYPAPDNKVLGYAHYKLAYVHWNKGDYAQALSELKKTIDFGVQFPALAGAKQIAGAARHDLLPLFALTGDPAKAYDFLHPLSGDSGGSNELTYKMMDDLGRAYLDIGNYKGTVAVYRDLMKRDEGPKNCLYQARISEATLALESGHKPAIKQELDRQLEAYERAKKRGIPAEALGQCASATADLIVETAMAFHLEAQGNGGVRGTGNQETMTLAAQLYDMAIRSFSAAEWKTFEFPKIVKEDWPTALSIRYQRADLLYFQKDWAACGPAFDAVVDADPKGPLAAEAAYASLLCYQGVYHASHQNRADRAGLAAERGRGTPDLSPKPLSPADKAMLGAFDRYLCLIKPAPGDKEAEERAVEIEYARARIYFENHHWEEAAVGFRGVALNHASSDAGIYAAQLYLEALNVLGSSVKPARVSCFSDMNRDVGKLAALYCGEGMKAENADACGGLEKVSCDLERQAIENLVREADAGSVMSAYEKAGQAYLDLWNKRGKKQRESKSPTCAPMDEVLHNGAKAFQAARLIAKAIAVRKVLIDPRYGLEKTALGKQAVLDIGKNYQAIAVYDEAASYYERFSRESAGDARAAQALQDAVVLRLGLGQEPAALDDAELFARSYGSKQPALSAQIAFAIAAHDVEHGDRAVAKRRLAGAMAAVDRSAPPDVQVVAHALLGRVLAEGNDVTGAAAELGKVRAAYRDPAAFLARLGGGSEPETQHRLAKVLMAVGEAQFFFAEQQRKEVDQIRFPEYRGSGRRDDVMRHIDTKVRAWIKKKQPAIEAAEKAYLTIEAIEPVPPPAFMIAAGSRVGQMWSRFVAEFRAAPIPKEWMQHGPSPYGDLTWDEIRTEYYNEIDRVSEPYRQRAKVAYQACLRYSLKYQHFDENSRACEVWLARTYGAEYHLVDEIKSAPAWIGTPMEGTPAFMTRNDAP